MFILLFLISLLLVLVPNSITAALWIGAVLIGGWVKSENETIRKKAKHRAN